ncbi:MAG: sensor histidine kinase [Sphingorhabdus sp.]
MMPSRLPRTLTGRIMLVTALAVLLVQGINMAMRYQMLRGRAVIEASSLIVAVTANRLDFGSTQPADRLGGRPSVRSMRSQSPLNLPEFHNAEDLAARLAMHLQSVYPEIQVVRLSTGPAAELPIELKPRPRSRQLILQGRGWQNSNSGEAALLSVRLADGSWLHSTARIRTRNILPPLSMFIETLMIYIGVLIPLLLVIRQMSKPLDQLNQRLATQGFMGGTLPLKPQGPEDIRRLIGSFNHAEARVNAMLTEKDVMLGAIGHDLKTPLASLRVRIESVEDEVERDKMAASITEMVQILDDILMLARLGKSAEENVLTDVGALVEMVVDEFDADDALAVATIPGKCRATVRPVLLRRALRNLIGNALQYGGQAEVAMHCDGQKIMVTIDDRGAGIDPAHIAAMFEPFTRGENSRNRASGGSGLGLTIARAIARAHGGDVTLENAREGGLRATLTVSQL